MHVLEATIQQDFKDFGDLTLDARQAYCDELENQWFRAMYNGRTADCEKLRELVRQCRERMREVA